MSKENNSKSLTDEEFMENWALADAAGRKKGSIEELKALAKNGDTEAIAKLMNIFGSFEDLISNKPKSDR